MRFCWFPGGPLFLQRAIVLGCALSSSWGIYFLCIRGSAHVSVCTPTPRVGLISGLSLPFRGSRLCRGQKARLKPHTWADRHRAMQILDKGGGVANPQPKRGPQPHTGSQMRPRPFLGLTILGLRDSDLAKPCKCPFLRQHFHSWYPDILRFRF